ncbi:MAG: glycoside hydrolase family 3 C-terminal domain-containing protein [Oscillospiraceae bacterium]|nr:glycoside hydrolase family 3 C-terminal domain-containing protein [Oscillospiraceae bacterium]
MFKDTSLSFDERVSALLKELTLDEKLLLITTRQREIPRLGINAAVIGSEAARGLVCRSEMRDEVRFGEAPSTVFPEPFGLAATFDPEVMHAMGTVTANEARIYHQKKMASLFLWAPTVDLERDPRWGRTEEGYGEDPLLTGKLAAAFTKGMYGADEKYARVIPTLKHFYANNNEEDRTCDNASIPIALKHDYYLKPFERAFKKGGALSVMTSYNEINGVEAMCNPELTELCKKEWGMLFSVTDLWDFVENVTRHKTDVNHADAIARTYKNGGADIINDDYEVVEAAVREALGQGAISEEDIDRALFGALKARFLLGEFDSDCPYNNIPESELCSDKSYEIAVKAAEESLILLRNRRLVLPFSKRERVSVIGVHADMNFRDWYTGSSDRNSTILDAIVAMVGRENVTYESGNDIIALRNSATGFYFAVNDEGVLVCDAPLINERCLLELYEWGDGEISLKSKHSGKFLGDCDIVKSCSDTVYGWFVKEKFTLIKNGRECMLKNCRGKFMHITENGSIAAGDSPKPRKNSLFDIEIFSSGLERVRRVATESHNVVVFCGNNPLVGARECFDRKHLRLPERQQAIADAVLELNGDAVMFLISGYPYAIDNRFAAVMHSPHAGPAMGTAVARALFGDLSPAGRCPITWYSSENELCDIKDYNIIRTESTYRYYNGIAAFPFGHGLSYTAFRYSALRLNKNTFSEGERVEVTLEVSNIGNRDSDEVVQLYAAAPRFSSAIPKKELVAFRRIHIPSGESAEITLSFAVDELRLWDINTGKFTLFGGIYELQAGASSADILRTCEIQVSGEDYEGIDVTKPVPAAASWEYSEAEFCTDKSLNEYALFEKYGGNIIFENCILNGEDKIEIIVSNPSQKTKIEVSRADNGAVLATLEIPQTGAFNRFTAVTADFGELHGCFKLKFEADAIMCLKSFRLFK